MSSRLLSTSLPENPPSRDPDGVFEPFQKDDFAGSPILFDPNGEQLVRIGERREPETWERKNGVIDEATREGIVAFWDIRTRKLIGRVVQSGSINDATFTPDGSKLITAASDGKIRIFGAPKWDLEHVIEHSRPRSMPRRLAMFPDGKRFMSAAFAWGFQARIWSLSDLTSTPLLAKHDLIDQVLVSHDGSRIAIEHCGEGSTIEIWDAKRLALLGRLRHDGGFTSTAFSPDGKWIATSIYAGSVVLWNSTTFEPHVKLPTYRWPESLAFSKDGKLLVCSTGFHSGTDGEVVLGKILIWSVDSGNLLFSFRPHGDTTGRMEMALSPDNRWLVVDSMVWDFEKIRREIGH
jgi:WD40 repeat protein